MRSHGARRDEYEALLAHKTDAAVRPLTPRDTRVVDLVGDATRLVTLVSRDINGDASGWPVTRLRETAAQVAREAEQRG